MAPPRAKITGGTDRKGNYKAERPGGGKPLIIMGSTGKNFREGDEVDYSSESVQPGNTHDFVYMWRPVDKTVSPNVESRSSTVSVESSVPSSIDVVLYNPDTDEVLIVGTGLSDEFVRGRKREGTICNRGYILTELVKLNALPGSILAEKLGVPESKIIQNYGASDIVRDRSLIDFGSYATPNHPDRTRLERIINSYLG